jgi:cardiolipin synthase A/B
VFNEAFNRLLNVVGWIRVDMLAPVGFAIAVIVTVHVLLHKRDIGASIGWIGLAWFAPIMGGMVYFVFGINRVRRRALRLRDEWPSSNPDAALPDSASRDDHLSALERAGRRISGRPAVPGNSVQIFHNGDEAYPRMLEAIGRARASIGLSTYIMRDDAGGGPFIDALIAAAKRGVAVRVLIDGIGSGYFSSRPYRRLRQGGVPVGRFMHSPLPWEMPFLNLRTHKKILVVDGKLGFTGGMNIGAENMVRTKPRHPVRDTHFLLRGPIVAQLTEAFVRDWAFVTDEDLDSSVWFPALEPDGTATARVVTSGPDQDVEKIEFLVLEAIACARQSIRIMTPYFLPDERLITSLSLAAMRGVEVDIVIPQQSDHPLVDYAARANSAPLLAAGCRIWLNPQPFEHTKLMLVDGVWCLIGSANWDMRSFRLNFELSTEIYEAELAAQLEHKIRSSQGRRVEQGALTRTPLPTRLRDAGLRLMLPYL